MKELLALFPDKFPESDCVKKDEREPDIFNGELPYWVLMKDFRFENEFTVMKLFPYVCHLEGEILYGLTDGQNVYDNNERPIHCDDRKVIGIHKEITK